jgi:hypothetical protein
MARMYRKLPFQGGDPRQVAEIVNNLVEGKMNCTGSITLNSTGTTTTLYNERIGYDSVIILMPRNANSAGETDHTYVSSKAIGSCVITHRNHGHSDCNWDYVIIG